MQPAATSDPRPPGVLARGASARVGPASSAQERLWILDRLTPGETTYNVSFALRLDGALDADALEQALLRLARRHESLRTVFGVVRGQVVQVVRPAAAFPLRREDLRGESDPEAAARARCRAEANRPFSLTEGPLLRGLLLRLGSRDHLLALTIHHIVVDGRSLEVLLGDLAAFYRLEVGLPAEEPAEPEVQFLDYAAWQRRHLTAETLRAELDHWRSALDGAPASTSLPLDRPYPPVRRARGSALTRDLPRELADGVRRVAAPERATPFMALLGIYASLVGYVARQDDLVVGTPVAGRPRPELAEIVGCYVNTLALRLDLAGAPSFRELLGRVRRTALAAFAHQEVPFDQVVQELAPVRDLRQTPIFQVAFAYEKMADERWLLGDVEARPFDFDTDIVKFDVELTAVETPSGLHTTWAFNEEVLDMDTITGLADRFERLLEAAIAEPDRPLREILLAEARERERAMAAAQVISRPDPEESLPELVAAHLAPEDRASSRRLAARLVAAGVGLESPVALPVEPSLAPVALLGVLEAGATAVAFDPDAPDELAPDAPEGPEPELPPLHPDLAALSADGAVLTHRALCQRLRRLEELGTESPLEELVSRAGSIDLDLPNTRYHVLDGDGEPVEAGTAGELWIGGTTIPREYAGAAATADRLRPDPYAAEPGARLLRTGAPARRGKDGTIELVAPAEAQPEPAAAPPAPEDDAPLTPLEQRIVAVWESVLGRSGISKHANFFSIGGNSIRALGMVAAIRDELGVTVPVASLFTNQTVADLAAFVEREASGPAAAPSSLVPLQEGEGPAVVLVHPVGGGVYWYRQLVESLPGVAVYGFEATEPHRSSLGELAERYLDELLERGPAPPLVLGGWSMGGVVAFELAHRLEGRTGFSAPVVLVDAHYGPEADEPDHSEVELAQAFVHELSLGFGAETPEVGERDDAREALAAALDAWGEAGVRHGFELDELARRFELFRANRRALLEHRPRPYGGPAYLVEAPHSPPLASAWEPLAPRLSSLAVEADHFTLLTEPYVVGVAEAVRRARAELEREGAADAA